MEIVFHLIPNGNYPKIFNESALSPWSYVAEKNSIMAMGTLSPSFSLFLAPRFPPSSGTAYLSSANSRSLLCFSSNNNNKQSFADQILDYIEGGPKLRKWYGAPDRLAKDESLVEEDDEFAEESESRDAVLVTDGDNEIGQMVILSLIIKRSRVKALVKNKRAAVEAFGTYVEPMTGDTNDKSFQKKVLKGVRALICPTEGFISQVESLKGVQHVVLLSQLSVYRGASGVQAFLNNKVREKAEQDESALMALGIPYTIIRAGVLQNTPGGKQGFSFEEGCAERGSLSKEDAAFICVEALESVLQSGLIIEVVNGEEQISDWKECFNMLMEKEKQ